MGLYWRDQSGFFMPVIASFPRLFPQVGKPVLFGFLGQNLSYMVDIFG
jgi:hypothetical protein